MCPELRGRAPQDVLTDHCGRCPDLGHEPGGSNELEGAPDDERVDRRVIVGATVPPDSSNECRPGSDWAEHRVVSAVLSDGDVALVVLLKLERDRHRVGREEGSLAVEHASPSPKELDVAEAEELGSPLAVDAGVLAGSHSEEESPDGELAHRPVFLGCADGGDLSEEAAGDGLLGPLGGVCLAVAPDLSP